MKLPNDILDRARWWKEIPMILTVHQVAWLLQIHHCTVYAMIHDGRLPAFKVGRQWRIFGKDLSCLNE